MTKTLLFAGQGCGLFRKGAGGGNMVNGKQYIAVAIGSTTSPAELVALALP